MIQTYKAHLVEKKQMSSDVIMFKFQADKPVEFVPGQYLILFVPQGQTPLRRLFSVSSAPSKDGTFELLVKIILGGAASEYLPRITPEDEVMFQGPAGMFHLNERGKNIILMATGTGLAPMRSILHAQLPTLKKKVNLFWGLRTSQDAYYVEEFEAFRKQYKHFSYSLCFSRDEVFEKISTEARANCATGRVPQVMDVLAAAGAIGMDNNTDYYLCGGRLAVETLRDYLYGKGIEKGNVFFEKF